MSYSSPQSPHLLDPLPHTHIHTDKMQFNLRAGNSIKFQLLFKIPNEYLMFMGAFWRMGVAVALLLW